MCAALTPAQYQLRTRLLSEAAKHVRATGFTNTALIAALESAEAKDINDRVLHQLFSRGFPIALVEHVVKSTNAQVHRELETSFNKDAIVKSIDANVDAFVQDRLILPSEKRVAEAAVLAKLELLRPLAHHWPHAVALEYLPQNLPYTVINLTEFVDTTVHYMERVATLRELLEPARRFLQSKAMASHIQHRERETADESPTVAFLRSFLQGVPLSTGPYASNSEFNSGWYLKRAQVTFLYGTATTSLLGDMSRNATDTRSLTKAALDRLF
ncbi:hypothetical protein NESM_000230200 [Novymonas esmeraldas]|uniref:Ubiquinone biosynthesis protein n=1 Tax=Novymonas esmeraldas TaxID=1808958 RepID=A0AAW0F5U5_9TRYP